MNTPILEQFHDPEGRCFNGVTSEQKKELTDKLIAKVGMHSLQIEEAASFCLAMIVRYALGLSAAGGSIGLLVNDTLAGRVALAGARHLSNAGSVVSVFVEGEPTSDEFIHQKNILEILGLPFHSLSDLSELKNFLPNCHNIICGLYSINDSDLLASRKELIDTLNDASTPIHAIECPLGLNVDTGKASKPSLIASSTLCLGAPFKGFLEGKDFLGRLYVCDISIPGGLYTEVGADDLSALFHSQPVVQIHPLTPEKLSKGI